MDVLTSPCFPKQWQLKVISSKWGMFNIMTAKKCTHAAHRHSWWCPSCILLLFPIWHLMGILILRGILKINKSISSKKSFAWVRANVQWVPSVCWEMCTQPKMYTRWLMKKMVKITCSLKIHAPSQKKRFNYDLHQTTSKDRSAILCLKFLDKVFSMIWSFLFRKINCSVRLKTEYISVKRLWLYKGERKKENV